MILVSKNAWKTKKMGSISSFCCWNSTWAFTDFEKYFSKNYFVFEWFRRSDLYLKETFSHGFARKERKMCFWATLEVQHILDLTDVRNVRCEQERQQKYVCSYTSNMVYHSEHILQAEQDWFQCLGADLSLRLVLTYSVVLPTGFVAEKFSNCKKLPC